MSKNLNHIICLDFETGGKDCQKDAITEIGMVAYRSDTFEEIWSYQAYIKPHYTRKKVVKGLRSKKKVKEQTELFTEDTFIYDEPMMIEKTHISMALLERKGKDIMEIAKEIEPLLKSANVSGGNTTKPVLLGQNIMFDIGFFQQFADVTGLAIDKLLSGKVDFYGNFQPEYLDTWAWARLHFALDEDVTSLKLGFIADLLGIELIEAHSALDDVYATGDILKTLVNRMRSNGDGAGSGKKKDKVRDHFKF
jgi:DNA polymerase III epsilon subunit-like protein